MSGGERYCPGSPGDSGRVELSGEHVGRGTAGYRFSENLMFQDETGLMYLKYDSWLTLPRGLALHGPAGAQAHQ